MGRAVPFLVLLTLLACCDVPTSPVAEPLPEGVRLAATGPLALQDSELWYRDPEDPPPGEAHDSDGVVLFEYQGQHYYHPVQMAQRALSALEAYRREGDPSDLAFAEQHADRLLSMADAIGGGLYIPYRFDYRVHSMPGEGIAAPWYSAMAQGQVLSLLVRLTRTTGAERYRAAMAPVAATFLRLRDADPVATARIDAEGYYWLEEFPLDDSDETLNGAIFGLYGVYEYWRLTGDPEMARVLRAGTATLRHYLPRYRAPGEPSYYCLKHRLQYEFYHEIHIEQLRHLAQITGDPWFDDFADTLTEDSPPEPQAIGNG